MANQSDGLEKLKAILGKELPDSEVQALMTKLTIASGNGAVAIAGDATEALIITGSQNVVGDNNQIVINQGTDPQKLIEMLHNLLREMPQVVKNRKLITTSPYKGLNKFEAEDRDHFFGREQFLNRLVQELEQTNYILLMGASGSGKSSLVRAGLIPRLKKQQGDIFDSFVFTPDRNPFESLYASLLSRFRQSTAEIAKVAADDTLIRVVNQLKPENSYWLIFIDQFEELFTMSDFETRKCFIDSLVRLGQTSLTQVKVVATMRADFLDRLSSYPTLVTLTDRHRPLLAAMRADELRRAIEQPAALHGVVFEDGLVEEIINSLQGQAGCLPLLQYTLDLLWKREVGDEGINDRTLNAESYWQLGGVHGALQQRVDELYNGLSESQQLAAKQIFLKLVEVGGDVESGTEWKPVRRRANRAEFISEAEQTVLTKLIDDNLLVSDATVGVATVEIAHEILLTSWDRLKEWIQDNRQAIALRNRLYDDVRLWIKENKRDDDLWGGAKLARVIELEEDSTFTEVVGSFSPEAVEFINASRELINRKEYEQKQREHEQKQRELKIRIAVGDERRTALVALLESCTVKLNIPGQSESGTGFFVAPGKILTCDPKIVEAGEQQIKVSWQDQENFNEATIDRLLPNLAVLKLTSDCSHPCVYLDETSSANDPVCTYGYADEFVKGGCGRGKLQKKAGKKSGSIEFQTYQDSLKLKSTPLLNLETSKVCGIVQSTHDGVQSAPDQDTVTVGKAISAATILATVDSLRQEQKEFHKKDHHWSNLLPPRCKPRTVALASLGMAMLVILVRAFQVFQPLELGFYDALLRNRINPPEPSDRFLIVTITKQDAEVQEDKNEVLTYSLSNKTLIQLLQKIETLKPIAVGLDIYRDQKLDQLGSSEQKSIETLFQKPNLFAVCKGGNEDDPEGVAPPPIFNPQQVGFSDFSLDRDKVLRRQLLAFHKNSVDGERCSSMSSFNLVIAQHYLQSQETIQTEVNVSEDSCQINFSNNVTLPRLYPNTGGYQGTSSDELRLFQGCQILLNYRDKSENQQYETISLEAFLKPEFSTQDYNNRIVLIGINRNDGFGDNVITPYDQGSDEVTPGVVVQAEMIDQIIDAALEKNAIIWVLPSKTNLLLILIAAFLGGGLGWWMKSSRQLGLMVVVTGGSALLISIAIFQFGGWVPLMSHFLALSATGSYVFWYNVRLRSAPLRKPINQ